MSYKSNLMSYLNNTNVNDEAIKIQDTELGSRLSLIQPNDEEVMSIDLVTRQISNVSTFRNVIVKGDHLAETIFFVVDRYADGLDLSQHKCLVKYINANNDYGESEVFVSDLLEDTIKFGWTLDNKITRKEGKVAFTIQFETIHNGVQYQLQTQPATLTVTEGLNVESTITNDDNTLYERLLTIVQQVSVTVQNFDTSIENKQEKLTAGEGIAIENNVISVSYPDGDLGRY